MEFELTGEQEDFRTSVDQWAERNLAEGARERAKDSEYPRDVATAMARQGLLGLTVSEAMGGQGASLMDAVLAIEAVARHCPKSADVIQAGNFGAVRTLAEYASPDQRERFLAPVLSGRAVLGLGMSEPGAGSAVTDLATTAVVEGDRVLINGTKIFSTHSADADCFLVYVRYGPGIDGIGSVLVERETPGLRIGPPQRFMSGEQWCELHFEDCAVPASQVLLGPGGFRRQLSGFNVERLGNAARSLALGRFAFNEARRYAMVREQFGRPLMEFQGLQWKFAEMLLSLESAQLLLYRAATHAAGGLPTPSDTALAKLAANTAGFEVANQSLQILGGLGFSEESLVHYCVLRTRGWQIAGGSTEMLKNRIAEDRKSVV